MAKKEKKIVKTEFLTFRLTKEELDMLKVKANREALSLSECLRELIMRGEY